MKKIKENEHIKKKTAQINGGDSNNQTNNETTDLSHYGVSTSIIHEIQKHLDHKKVKKIHDLIKEMHKADVADIINKLSPEYMVKFLRAIKHKIDPEVLAYVDENIIEDLVDTLGTKDIAAALSDLEVDDAVQVMEELDEEHQKEILESIPAKERAIIEESLTYPEDSAGRLMQRKVVFVPSFWSVKKALEYINSNDDLPDDFYNIFVIDPKHRPIGLVKLSKLVRLKSDKKVEEVMNKNIHTIPYDMDQEEVANLFRHYGLVSAPVVDKDGRIIGSIMVDDVVDVIEEEAEEDIMRLGGVSESDFRENIIDTSMSRLMWLIVTMINVTLSVFVISRFEVSIKEYTVLAFFLPVAAAMGGNSGLQVVTVVVRALTTKELRPDNAIHAIIKEVSVGVINGVALAIIIGLISFYFAENYMISFVVASALVCNIIWANLIGAILPIVLDKYGLDPTISASPILSSVVDISGYTIFLGLATLFLL